MMESFNPFPDYTVVRLNDERNFAREPTVVTPPIDDARKLVKRYLERLPESTAPVESKAVLVPVKGDFGTGKTHLLLDVADQVQTQWLGGSGQPPTILRLTCLEADALGWFGAAIGPQLDRPFLSDVVTYLYADAGRAVADQAKLTEAAAAKLATQPAYILELVRGNLLNASAVERKFNELMEASCQHAPENVRKALAGLVWAETAAAARRLLRGETLTQAEKEQLRLTHATLTEEEAAGVLAGLAGIHAYLRRPFVILIDELEHFIRRDTTTGTKQNATWMKRLLEGLGAYSTLSLVAGHWSAWHTKADFLDRFSPIEPIELLKLTAADVLLIVQARVPSVNIKNFGQEEAAAVAEFGAGNMRRILSLCHTLFREMQRFSRPLTREEIRGVAERLGQRIPLDQALLRIQEILEERGLQVRRGGAVEGITFDLVALQGTQPRVVVEGKHAVHQTDLHDTARRFIEQMRVLSERASEVVGYFVADGNIDDALLQILKSAPHARVLWFDLTDREVMTKIADALGMPTAGPTPEAARLKDLVSRSEQLLTEIAGARSGQDVQLLRQLQEQRQAAEKEVAALRTQISERESALEQQLTALEQRRVAEMEDLYARLQRLINERGPREATVLAPTDEEIGPKLHAMYTELTRRPSLLVRIRHGGASMFLATAALLIGIALAVMSSTFASGIAQSSQQFVFLLTQFYVIAVVAVLAGGWVAWRTLERLDGYFEHSARLLRELYVRVADPATLIRADNILRASLEEYGPRQGRRRAEYLLAHEFPEVFRYLSDAGGAATSAS